MSSTSSSVGGGGSNSDRRHPRPVGGSGVGASGENENLACPRCNSNNTKFCYYNNYNLSQPRYFCKSCRRYWTQGGTLRNIPVGGGNRKSAKRSRTSSSSSSSTSSNASSHQETKTIANSVSTNVGYKLPDVSVPFFNVSGSGSFTSLLNSQGSGSSMGTGSGLWTVGQDELGVGLEEMGGFGLGLSQRRGGWPWMEYVGEGYAGSSWQLGSYVDGGDYCVAWPELAISTPTEDVMN